jgi:hypothetical protein
MSRETLLQYSRKFAEKAGRIRKLCKTASSLKMCGERYKSSEEAANLEKRAKY